MHRFRFIFILLVFSLCVPAVFAGGSQDSADSSDTRFGEWSLAVTSFDVSSLPASRQIFGVIILRSVIDRLNDIEFRTRGYEEMEYYRNIAQSSAQNTAARALAAKQNERDLLIFRGDPEWRYTKNLANIEKDIFKLEESFLEIQAMTPYITPRPLLKIQDDSNSAWPNPPGEGDEYTFCTGRKADAFLAGKVTEYYGRIFLTLKIYTLYSRSWS